MSSPVWCCFFILWNKCTWNQNGLSVIIQLSLASNAHETKAKRNPWRILCSLHSISLSLIERFKPIYISSTQISCFALFLFSLIKKKKTTSENYLKWRQGVTYFESWAISFFLGNILCDTLFYMCVWCDIYFTITRTITSNES